MPPAKSMAVFVKSVIFVHQERIFMEQKTKETETRLLSVKETCKRLGIGHWAVYQQIHQHKLKTIKIGKRRLISVQALNEFIANQERYGA